MRKICLFVLLALSGCATVALPPPAVKSASCGKEASRRRGHDDAAQGRGRDAAFLSLCSVGERDAYVRAYRDGYDAGKRQRQREFARNEILDASAIVRLPASPNWSCEVEATSRVFSGVGVSESEAALAARDACAAHFRANACGPAECKSTL